jgi:TetR/AcrR family transcriptional repressor of bet genes
MARPSNTIERRTQIARALLTVMAREGYERASIADVARVAGVAPGLVHYHFENKLEILVAAAHELGQDYEARLDRALAPAVGDPEAELSAFVDAHLRVGKGADPAALACWIDVSGESLREPRVREVAASILAKATERLAGIVRRGTASGRFECDSPEAAAAAIFATIHGYLVLGAMARSVVPRGSAAGTTLAMCRGLLRPSPGGRASAPWKSSARSNAAPVATLRGRS